MLVYQRVSIRCPDHPKNAPIPRLRQSPRNEDDAHPPEMVAGFFAILRPSQKTIPLASKNGIQNGSEMCGKKWLNYPLAQKKFWSQNEIVDEVRLMLVFHPTVSGESKNFEMLASSQESLATLTMP